MMKENSDFTTGEPVVAVFPWLDTTPFEDIYKNHFHSGVVTEVIKRPSGAFMYRVSGTERLVPEDRLERRTAN
jgi:hypothetical protein